MMEIARSVDEAWFDSAAVLESDCSDEDFLSIPDDVFSLNRVDTTSLPNNSSRIDSNHRHGDVIIQHSNDQLHRPGDSAGGNSAWNFSSGVGRNSVHPLDTGSRVKSSNKANVVILDEISSSVYGSASRENGLLDCGILPCNCLPRLASTINSVEKQKSLADRIAVESAAASTDTTEGIFILISMKSSVCK